MANAWRNTITTSIWSGTAWEVAATTEVSFTVTQVGLYALAAQNGTTHAAHGRRH